MRFEFATATRLIFGPGTVGEAVSLAAQMTTAAAQRRVLVVTGKSVERAAPVLDQLKAQGIAWETFAIADEPTVGTVSQGAELARASGLDAVLAIGGGSALDGAKAIAALITNGGDALDYVEVVGRGKAIHTRAAPLIAVPTTAGTGSEVTKNAVLSVPDLRVKVSMRSNFMLPHAAVVDPVLSHSMPPMVTASTGLDALTHLIEAYVSNAANPLTDALCRDGIRLAARALRRAYQEGNHAQSRIDMSLVSVYGGLALANARLGAVHGFAGPCGGMFSAPHGCICGRFLPHVMEVNVRALEARAPDSPALPRFAEIAALLTGNSTATPARGVDWIQALCAELVVPSLGAYGVTRADTAELVSKAEQASSMKGNPIVLTNEELTELVTRAL